ncbi:hydroxyisourate hydrolase [Marinococcus halotolerans]|jgi:5-hydroxyisourate hydrolase|uniref:hydroxyisourate hydrolase n=1 Tax=Marinococcus halotolerans TaxID=301092 RepID=UPI0003B78493|nr:hydroxyisourate hydrolase [Marinococcus halotolerans]
MGLTTHVLDLASGRPGEGIALTLYRLDGSRKIKEAERVTNADGRVDEPLLQAEAIQTAAYEVEFQTGEYLRQKGWTKEDPHFLETVALRVTLSAEETSYHLPLLLSPYGYQTYRGS